jgi:signal transduction histidine kinase
MSLGTGNRATAAAPASTDWLGESEMATLIRTFDWSTTPLGPLTSWQESLKSAVAVCLHSRFQMAIYWGPELTCIYNDAERRILGGLHPSALGMPAAELLRDSWDMVGPQLRAVVDRGEATWAVDQPLWFDRRGVLEAGYFTYSYSPIPEETGGVGGVLLVTQETTARVLAERRLDALRELATSSMDAPSVQEACQLAADSLHQRAELDFVVIYLTGDDGARATCAANGGGAAHPPLVIELSGSDALSTLFRGLAGQQSQIRLIAGDLITVKGDGGPHAPSRAVAAPIRRGSADPVDGFLVAGIDDGAAWDQSYRRFIEMVGLGLGRSVAAARAREGERARLRSLAALEQAKTTLFSNAAHELRTPLALILGPLERALDRPGFPPAAREEIDVARRGATRMLKIVNGLLDFSRIEAGENTGYFQPTDLAQLTRDVAAMFRSTAEAAGLHLTVDCPPMEREIDVDREAWEQIVSNLLSNALKFTPTGAISVRTCCEGEDAVLAVSDTGIGIAPENLHRIFDRFYRVEDPRARAHEGTGLGLALVQQLVHVHDGSVTADSTPGQGTNILVRIPLSARAVAADAQWHNLAGADVGAAAAPVVEEADGWLQAGEFRRPATAKRKSSRAHVLVVEDNRDMGAYLSRLLTPTYTVHVVTDGAEALRIALDDAPDLVISDVMMPGVDGFRLLRDLRSHAQTRHVPVILVSARADTESTLKARQLGADDYLVKPFGARELLVRIRATLQSSRSRSADAEARGRAEERASSEGELRALVNDLKAAQRRIASAGDAERRRIERDLHDGAQQRLMAIRLELGLLSERLGPEPTAAHQQLDRLRAELDGALEELRELAHGLYPPVLASDGLRTALSAAARHAAIPVDVSGSDFPRMPRAIESAAYFCCLEALQNVAKHGGEGVHATVTLAVDDGALELKVSDDGIGFDDNVVPVGYGLTNLSDRLEALGGEARITSTPGRGTTLAGRIPLP